LQRVLCGKNWAWSCKGFTTWSGKTPRHGALLESRFNKSPKRRDAQRGAMAVTTPAAMRRHSRSFSLERGVPLRQIVTQRSDLEELQYDFMMAVRSLARARWKRTHTQGT